MGPRRAPWTVIAVALAAGGVQDATTCDPIAGLDPLLTPGRVVLLGEIHGTVESPAFALAVACHAMRAGLDVVVALELPATAAGEVATFLESEGEPSDRAALLDGPPWTRDYQDGRTSRAMADLLDGVRRLRAAGATVRVALFDAQPPGGGQARERAMAATLAESAAASPEALHVVLTGNLHSRITTGNGRSADYEPMGSILVRRIGAKRVIALDVSHAGGSAWICAPGCGAAALRGSGAAAPWRVEIEDATRPAGHHGSYVVGSIGASPPAIREDDLPPPAPVAESPAATPPVVEAPQEPFPSQTPELLAPFQGSWDAYQLGSRVWTIEISGQRFSGVLGPDDWYEGTIRVHTDTEPNRIDFVIEDCRCSYRGMTSEGIFRRTGDSILVAAPRPGAPRPEGFVERDGRTVEWKRAHRP